MKNSPDRNHSTVMAALTLAASLAGCGEDPATKPERKYDEPTGDCTPHVECVDAQAIAGGEVEVTGCVTGVEQCFDSGYIVRVGASPENVDQQSTEDGSMAVVPDLVNNLLPPETTRITRAFRNGCYTLRVPQDEANRYDFGIDAYSPAVMNAEDCVNKGDKAYCKELGYDTMNRAQRVLYHGRPGHEDLITDKMEAHSGTVLNPNRNSCNNPTDATPAAIVDAMRSALQIPGAQNSRGLRPRRAPRGR